MRGLTLEKKTYLFVAIFFLLILLSSLWIRYSFQQISSANEYQHTTLVPVAENLALLKFDVVQVQQWLTDISATRGLDGLNDGLDLAEEFYQGALAKLDQLTALLPERADDLAEIERSLTRYYQQGVVMANAYMAEGPTGGNPIMGQFDSASEVLQSEIAELSDFVVDLRKTSRDQLLGSIEKGVTIGGLAVLMGVFFVVILLVFIRLLIIQPLNELMSRFQSLNAGDADVHFRFQIKTQDELGVIQQEFNAFLNTLDQLSSAILAKATALLQQSSMLKSLSTTNKGSVDEQLQEIDQLSSAMNQMNATSLSVRGDTEELATEIHDIADIVQNNAKLSEHTHQLMETTSDRIEQAANTIRTLNDRTGEIVAMLDTIRTIAEQTNLLALNAAIEAARAGEQGRGFAVVADEVRTLATRTQEATVQINDIITALQDISSSAVTEMEQCNQDTNETGQASQEALAVMRDVNDKIVRMRQALDQTKNAMAQQSEVSEVNTQSIIRILDASKAVEQSVTLGDHSIGQLDTQVRELEKLAKTFTG